MAQRAGVAKSTFFRHFPDKRDLLVAGRQTLSRLLAEGIAEAPESVGLAVAMTDALVARGVPDPTAHLAGELGVLAFKRGYAQWLDADAALAPYVLAALEDLGSASRSLT
ncbi:TetR/AcrR family transcriptional regulator [Nocardia sp. NBC_01377]|uniref:TetR family transcriptional regulator n=1 Tax=Nocardia sp. NBC_01377 TaxID=2903595 RepID=UPI003249AF55